MWKLDPSDIIIISDLSKQNLRGQSSNGQNIRKIQAFIKVTRLITMRSKPDYVEIVLLYLTLPLKFSQNCVSNS